MKTKFSTIDIMAVLHDLQQFIGMRVNNVYDIDSKTYLIRLMKPDCKGIILFESGSRLHSTEFDWPKALAPSSFSMKLRKHIKQKRLEYIRQVGADRIVEMQFGSGEVACHVFVELYDRGNVILTDYSLTILNVLRPRTDKDTDVKFVVKEKYPIHLCRQWQEQNFTPDSVRELFTDAKPGDNLRKILNPKFPYGPALLEHCLMEDGLGRDWQYGKQFRIPEDLEKLSGALLKAETILGQIRDAPSKGFIIYKVEKRMADQQEVEAYEEFHPFLFLHNKKKNDGGALNCKEFPSFNSAVDDFFSKLETQKLDLKALQQEKVALKKCENIRKDHEQRLNELQAAQDTDFVKAEVILANSALVDRAILVIRTAIANQLSWEEIHDLVDEGKEQGDPAAMAIKKLKLETSHVTLSLPNIYADGARAEDDPGTSTGGPIIVDIDLNLNPHQNARKYFDHKKQAAAKEQKTLEASKKALKAAESKMHETLKQVQVKTSIMKSRKPYWFEKFLWFFSSDNYLVIGGRDAQQNELLVKRYLRPGDVYVHADIRGAASVIIKSPKPSTSEQNAPPPRTLHEAGTMAVCYSAAWDAKVVTSAWWVWNSQVSKTAPTGEYLTTGSFIIRGKKNFLPPCQLVMGFGILFRLDDESIPKHQELLRQRLSRIESVDQVVEEAPAECELDVESGESEDEKEEIKKEKGSVDKGRDGDEAGPTTMEEHIVGAAEEEKGEKKPLELEEDKEEEKLLEVETNEEKVKSLEVERSEEEKSLEAEINGADDEEMEFPDIEVPLRHLSTETKSAEVSVIQLGPKRILRPSQAELERAAGTKPNEEPVTTAGGQLKRGQKQRQKKIKEKYKDQDEEERQLRMKLLGSAGKVEEEKKGGKKKSKALSNAQKNKQQVQAKKPPNDIKKLPNEVKDISVVQTDKSVDDQPTQAVTSEVQENHHEEGDQEEQSQWTIETAGAQETLTGDPLEDYVLLFGVPTCAPYSALSSFKYKVKLTPGTGKRGKATKTAMAVFVKDRTCSAREKELLKAMQDQDLARNLPGKVKVSAPQLTAVKKK